MTTPRDGDKLREAVAAEIRELVGVIEAVRGDRGVLRVSGNRGDPQDVGVLGIERFFDLMKRTVAALSQPPAPGGREEIARIIAPEVFTAAYQHYYPDRSNVEQFTAYQKADAILALGPALSPQVRAAPMFTDEMLVGGIVDWCKEQSPTPAPGADRAAVIELADEIERSTGLLRMVPGEGTVQLGVKKTAMVIAALRALSGNDCGGKNG